MVEQEDWQFIEEDIGPAQLQNNKGSSSALSEKSDANLQFMEASLTESFLKTKDTATAAAAMNKIKIHEAASGEDEIITTKKHINTSGTPIRINKQTKNQPAAPTSRGAVAIALISTSLITLLLAASFVASSLIYSSYKQYSTGGSSSMIESPSSVLFLRSSTSSHPPSCSLPGSGGGDARLPEASSGGDTTNNKEIHARIDRLEQRVNQHDVQLSSLESQMNELTEMMLKLSSCGAYFYKTKPEFDFSKAVPGQDISDSLFVEGRTKISTHGSNSKDLIHALPQCRQDILNENCARKNGFVLVDDDGGGGRRENNDDITKMRDLNELRDRIVALEHGIEAMKSLLSTANE